MKEVAKSGEKDFSALAAGADYLTNSRKFKVIFFAYIRNRHSGATCQLTRQGLKSGIYIKQQISILWPLVLKCVTFYLASIQKRRKRRNFYLYHFFCSDNKAPMRV